MAAKHTSASKTEGNVPSLRSDNFLSRGWGGPQAPHYERLGCLVSSAEERTNSEGTPPYYRAVFKRKKKRCKRRSKRTIARGGRRREDVRGASGPAGSEHTSFCVSFSSLLPPCFPNYPPPPPPPPSSELPGVIALC